MASYARHGYGLNRVDLKDSGIAIGICGLVRREGLDVPDIGFAFLPAYWAQGYAFESASAIMRHAREALGIARIVAIAAVDNHGSTNVLKKLGLKYESTIRLPGIDGDSMLFAPGGRAVE